MQIHSVGVDLDKTTFHLVALGAAGKVLVRKNIVTTATAGVHREHADVADRLGSLVWSHFLGRALRKQGHDVRLIVGQFVKPFVESNKNDYVDAEAIAEAVGRKNMRFRPAQDGGSSGSAGHPWSSRPPDLPAQRGHQPATSFFARTRHGLRENTGEAANIAVRVDPVFRKEYLHRCRQM